MKNSKESELEKRILDELSKIDGDSRLLPAINISNGDARPYIEIDTHGYNYVCNERGVEMFRKIPFDTEELIYEVFKDITNKMASKWESQNRKEGEDSRRQLFAKRIELMQRIKPEFGKRIETELQWFLRHAPFKD